MASTIVVLDVSLLFDSCRVGVISFQTRASFCHCAKVRDGSWVLQSRVDGPCPYDWRASRYDRAHLRGSPTCPRPQVRGLEKQKLVASQAADGYSHSGRGSGDGGRFPP